MPTAFPAGRASRGPYKRYRRRRSSPRHVRCKTRVTLPFSRMAIFFSRPLTLTIISFDIQYLLPPNRVLMPDSKTKSCRSDVMADYGLARDESDRAGFGLIAWSADHWSKTEQVMRFDFTQESLCTESIYLPLPTRGAPYFRFAEIVLRPVIISIMLLDFRTFWKKSLTFLRRVT